VGLAFRNRDAFWEMLPIRFEEKAILPTQVACNESTSIDCFFL
jgi:hypothetical protein